MGVIAHPVSGSDYAPCQWSVPHEVPHEETLKYVSQSSHAYATTHKPPSEAVKLQYGVWKLMVSEEAYL